MASITPTPSASFSARQNSPAQESGQLTSSNRRETGRRWLESIAAGAVVNVAIWLAITQVLSTPLRTQDELAIGGHEVQIPLVLITTLVAATVGAVGMAGAGKLLRSPSLPWAAVTVAAGLVSLMGPASAAVDGRVQLGLSTMHVATAVVVLGAHLRPRAERRVD